MLAGSVGLAAGAATSLPFLVPRYDQVRRPSRSRVAILRAEEYSERLERDLLSGLRLFGLDLRGKSVLLKPNLVDFLPGVPINTHPLLVTAAAECFRRLGAASVVVGEGPGHQRDTELVLSESGFRTLLDERRIPFVDLNRDQLVKTKLRANYTGLGHIWLPRTVLNADFVVSMPKVKTHHWSGVTLSMKNYVWCRSRRKIRLAQEYSALAGNRTQHRRHLCDRADPFRHRRCHRRRWRETALLPAASRALGAVVLSDDPVAADATCARLMGFAPEMIAHIHETAKFLGNAAPELIDQLADPVTRQRCPSRRYRSLSTCGPGRKPFAN